MSVRLSSDFCCSAWLLCWPPAWPNIWYIYIYLSLLQHPSIVFCCSRQLVNPYTSSVLFVGYKETVQTQIRRHRTWRLIRISTVCLENYKVKFEWKWKIPPNNTQYTDPIDNSRETPLGFPGLNGLKLWDIPLSTYMYVWWRKNGRTNHLINLWCMPYLT